MGGRYRDVVIKLPWKAFAGFSVALLAILVIFGSVVSIVMERLREHILPLSISIAVLGLTMMLAGSRRARRAARNKPAPDEGDGLRMPGERNPLNLFGRLEFWGCLLLIASPLMYVLNRPPGEPKPEPIPVMAATSVEPPKEFPVLRLQGFISNGPQSSAVINGKVLYIGDDVEGVILVSVETGRVTVRLGDQEKVLLFR